MKKQIIEELTRIRTLMNVELINEDTQLISEQLAQEIEKLIIGVFKSTLKSEEKALFKDFVKGMIKDDAKKAEFVTLLKSAEGKKFIAELEKAVNKMPDGLDKDAALRKINSMKSAEQKWASKGSGSGSLPNPSGGATKVLFQTYDEALKYFESVVNSLGGEFPNVFKNTKVGRSIMESSARMSVGKTEQEAFDFLRKSFADKELVLKDMPKWYQQYFKSIKPTLETFFVSRNLDKSVNFPKSGFKTIFALFLFSFFARVGKEIVGYEDNTPDLWQKVLIAGFKMLGIAIPTFLEAGQQGFEKGKEEYNRNKDTRNEKDRNNEKPRDEKPKEEKPKEEKPKTPDNTSAKGGDLDRL